jgi:CheY-like chemotaxis protein
MENPTKVLIVEDDLITQQILGLYMIDYEHIIVSCGEEAIKECEANKYDIILMDIRLKSGIDGVKTFKKIKLIKEYKNVPVLAITAYAMRGDKEFFLEEGFDGYLAKPFLKENLIDIINSVMKKVRV